MHLPTLILSLFVSFAVSTPTSSSSSSLPRRQASTSASSSVDTYLATEVSLAKSFLLANIGPIGSNAQPQQAPAGIILSALPQGNLLSLLHWIFPASDFFIPPPDNYTGYTRVRDSAIVGHVLVDQFQLGVDKTLLPYLDDYVSAQKILQDAANSTASHNGLGDGKFFVNGSLVPSTSGSPQRDSPALRVITMISWGNHLLSQKNRTYFDANMWPIIKADLDYLAGNWNKTGLDIWEELDSSSFFTTLIQHRALRQGAFLAGALGENDLKSKYAAQADAALCFAQSYWNSEGYLTANTGGGRSGIDASTVLASVHGFDVGAGCDSATFQPCSDRALANLFAFVNATSNYPINSDVTDGHGVIVGRYPEDTALGGNPWYTTTLAVAQQLYSALTVWNNQRTLQVTALSQPFFDTLVPGTALGVYSAPSTIFTNITTAVKDYADSFVSRVAQYTPPTGHLSQQFLSSTGEPFGLQDFSWSYAALLSMSAVRNGTVAPTWGAQGLTVNATCMRNTFTDVGEKTGPVVVGFNVQATTKLGENIYLAGSVDELGKWSTDSPVLLSADGYPIWNVSVKLPASTTIQYKYIRKFNGDVTWESGPNHEFTTPASGNFTLYDVWRQ